MCWAVRRYRQRFRWLAYPPKGAAIHGGPIVGATLMSFAGPGRQGAPRCSHRRCQWRRIMGCITGLNSRALFDKDLFFSSIDCVAVRTTHFLAKIPPPC